MTDDEIAYQAAELRVQQSLMRQCGNNLKTYNKILKMLNANKLTEEQLEEGYRWHCAIDDAIEVWRSQTSTRNRSRWDRDWFRSLMVDCAVNPVAYGSPWDIQFALFLDTDGVLNATIVLGRAPSDVDNLPLIPASTMKVKDYEEAELFKFPWDRIVPSVSKPMKWGNWYFDHGPFGDRE